MNEEWYDRVMKRIEGFRSYGHEELWDVVANFVALYPMPCRPLITHTDEFYPVVEFHADGFYADVTFMPEGYVEAYRGDDGNGNSFREGVLSFQDVMDVINPQPLQDMSA